MYLSGTSNTLTVTQTLFHRCITTNTQESIPGGGGICVSVSSSSLNIHSCTFIACQADVEPRGGGGFFASQIQTSHTSSSIFLSCATANAGGAIFSAEVTNEFSVTNSLFSRNSAYWGGGAIRERTNTHFEYPYLIFSFFAANVGPAGYGNDLSLGQEISGRPFFHSFSTSLANRVSYYDSTIPGYSEIVDWLPQCKNNNTRSRIEIFTTHKCIISHVIIIARWLIAFSGFYCSKLTDKTAHSFISSNSSFTDCVRKQNASLTKRPNDLHTTFSSDCVDNSISKCFTFEQFPGNQNPLSSTPTRGIDLTADAFKSFTLFQFYSCIWRNCEAQYGGGIYLKSGSSISLSVIKGEFYSCKANPSLGGGIYLEGIGQVDIKDSLFHQCSAVSSVDYGGGGIEMWKIQNPPNIKTVWFIFCESGNDAGGLGIWSSPFYQETCVKECHFIECKLHHPTSSGGGGMIVWYSSAAVGCSECLFSKCNSAFLGGGFAYYITSSQALVESPLISFCFCNENTAKENCGNDAFFVEWTPHDPFLLSFSMSSSWTIAFLSSFSTISNTGTYKNRDIWLPQGTLTHTT